MADNAPAPAAPVASGGRPASLANTFCNGTIGRIKTFTCTRADLTAQASASPPPAPQPAPAPGQRAWYERSWEEIARVADKTLDGWKKSAQTVWEALPFTSDDATAAAARGRIGEGIKGTLEGLGTLSGPKAEMAEAARLSGNADAIELVEEMQRRQRQAFGAIGDAVKGAWDQAYARNGAVGASAMVLATLGMEALGGKGLGALAKTAEKIADIVRLSKTPLEAANKLDEAIAAAKAAGASADEIALLERARAERLARARKEAAAARDGTVVVAAKSAPSSVWHATANPRAAKGVVNGIDPAYLNPNSRFGAAFYVAEQPGTTIAELAHHGVDATHGIRFSVNADAMKVLDLTKPEIAGAWGYRGGPISSTTQSIGALAQERGFNVIRFHSERSNRGVNLAVLDNFNEILKPVIVTPVKP